MNHVECLASSAIDFAPGVWFNPLLDSGNGFRVVFAGADSDCIEFRSITKRDPPISFGDAERSQCQVIWNDSDCTEFGDPWNSNAFRRLKKG